MTNLTRGGLAMSVGARTRERCDCEVAGDFHAGVSGILAAMKDGRVAPQAIVERCDQCCRFESDAVAVERLAELGTVARFFPDVESPPGIEQPQGVRWLMA